MMTIMWKPYLLRIAIINSVFLFLSCGSAKDLEILLEENKEQIILRKFMDDNQNARINIPYNLKIRNSSFANIEFLRLTYMYNSNIASRSIRFQVMEDEIEVRTGKVRAIGPMQAINYRFITRHYIGNFPSEELDVYLEEFKSKNQDTLHIGTIAQFKKKHPGFLERLTKNDSISVTLLNNEDMPGKVIKVPVRY